MSAITAAIPRRPTPRAPGPGPGARPVDPARQAQLLAAVAAGHGTAAFVELFNYFAPRLKAYMKRLGANDSLADELTQDVMVTVWRKAGAYDPAKSAVSSWIFTIARHQRIDALRRERRRALNPDEPLLWPEEMPPPDATLQATQRARRVRAALDTLSREQRAVVHLAFFDGKSHAEIASSLAIPLGTVKSRMRLAFEHIREALGGDDARAAA